MPLLSKSMELLPGLRKAPSFNLKKKKKSAFVTWLKYILKFVKIQKLASLKSLHVASFKINALRASTLASTS